MWGMLRMINNIGGTEEFLGEIKLRKALWIISLKRNRFVRALCRPVAIYNKKRLKEAYDKEPYPSRLRALKDSHAGERCFIIGNGSSLRISDLEKLKEEYCFAVNRIYELFDETSWRPSYYVATDDVFIQTSFDIINNIPSQLSFIEFKYAKDRQRKDNMLCICKGTDYVPNISRDARIYISEDLSDHYCAGYTVTFVSIQLAIYMGFKDIILLGVDCNYSRSVDKNGVLHRDERVQDYFDGKMYRTTLAYTDGMIECYEVAREYCDSHGIIIRNATRGGKLEVFERVNFDDLFDDGKRQSGR